MNAVGTRTLKSGYYAIATLCALLILELAAVRPALAQEEPQSVLVFASSGPGNGLETAEIAGLREMLPEDAELVVDHLDVTRITGRDDYLELYFGVAHRKYKNRRFAAIVALNDDAIRFVDYYRTNLFARIPLLLCGSGHDMPAGMSELTNWTGVFCAPDPAKTIQLSLALHPQAQKVHVITDGTSSGQLVRNRIREAVADKPFSAYVKMLSGDEIGTYGRLRREAPRFEPDSIVFFGGYARDYRAVVLLPHRLMPRLSADSPAPIYTLQAETVGAGAVGGFVADGEQIGRTAGKMLRQVLAGASPASIPPVALDGVWMFDAVQLERWGIDERRLPAGSRIIGRQLSFFEKNKWILLIGGAIVGVELSIIAMLLINRAGRIRAQRALQASETRYRTLFESSEDLFMIFDPAGAVLHANPATCRMLGYALAELVGRKHVELVAPADSPRAEACLDASRAGERTLLETRFVTREGAEMPVECLYQPFDCESRPAAVCFARSLSERVKIQRLTQEISENERQAMGQDIHDGLGQYLTALRFQCRRLEQRVAEELPLDAAEVSKLDRIASELAFEVRSLARSLVSQQMLSRTLESALRELMEINTRHFDIQAELDMSLAEGMLLPDISAQLYRIVQEAMRNAVRHGGASLVRVVLRAADGEDMAELVVENNGRPFDLLQERRAGLGLGIMEQRARLIGGTLDIQPGKDGGGRLTCRFPLHPHRQEPVESMPF
jgi:PAS domain S-box-containing protein